MPRAFFCFLHFKLFLLLELEFEITSMHRGEWVGANVQIGNKQECTYILGKVAWICLQLCSQHSQSNCMSPFPLVSSIPPSTSHFPFPTVSMTKVERRGLFFPLNGIYKSPNVCRCSFMTFKCKVHRFTVQVNLSDRGICQLETYWWNEWRALMSERLVNAERRSGVWQCHFLRQMSTHSSQVALSAASIQKRELSCQVKVPVEAGKLVAKMAASGDDSL